MRLTWGSDPQSRCDACIAPIVTGVPSTDTVITMP